MSKQTQGTMLMVGALSGTVGAVAFVALMVLGEFAVSPAVFMAVLVAAVAAIVLFIGFHAKPTAPVGAHARAASPLAKSAVVPATPSAPSVPVAVAPAAVASVEGTRPAALSGPREGGADDLKRIKGIGPKLEELCHTLGFYHFDQIAHWSADEVAWVDENLEGFKGRVSRDTWVEQARLLAAGGETEFSKKVDDGTVY